MKTLMRFIKGVCFGLIVFGAFTLGQATQYHHSSNEVRYTTLQSWLNTYPEQRDLTHRFIDRCINHPPRMFGSDKTLSLYECGESLGAYDLVDTLEQAERMLSDAAWPLSEL
ncbi:hypothetical protein [Vibrio owensii]|uniref:hypothetical protein n=1 Tax=Vibrio owensii TaxID=696485 RepID=UPI0038CEC7F0